MRKPPKPRKTIMPTPRVLKLLKLLQGGPLYGKRIADLAPDMFFFETKLSSRGAVQKNIGMTDIYSLLRRAEQAGIIEQLKNFRAPVADDESKNPVHRRKYYGITPDGRAMLKATQDILED